MRDLLLRNLTLIVVFAAVLVGTGYAQPNIDCTSDDLRLRYTAGAVLSVPCDTMYVLSNDAYRRFYEERHKLRREAELADRHIDQIRGIVATQDSLLEAYRRDIRTLEEHLSFTHTKLDTLQMHLEDSIELTDEVIGIARRKNVLSYIAGGLGGAALGIVVGLLMN